MARTASPRLPRDRVVYCGAGFSASQAVCSPVRALLSSSFRMGAAVSVSVANSMKEKSGLALFSSSTAYTFSRPLMASMRRPVTS